MVYREKPRKSAILKIETAHKMKWNFDTKKDRFELDWEIEK